MLWYLPANRSEGLTSEVWIPTKASWRKGASGRKDATFGTIGSATNLFSLIFVFDYYIVENFRHLYF